jgi:hypothetical protein
LDPSAQLQKLGCVDSGDGTERKGDSALVGSLGTAGKAGLPLADNPNSGVLARNSLGWDPKELELLTDMRESGYFA